MEISKQEITLNYEWIIQSSVPEFTEDSILKVLQK